ncbi:CHAT domain-containing protein [Streptomyces cyaneofuscatus]|uniref:CHAT domain-containing protein n=1 Tax=Streptomyces cyaneofuscatus TaxID=66883 RepID=UPI0036815D10
MLLSHAERDDDEAALVEAVAYAQEAVALVPDGPEAALPLANLSLVLGSLGSRNSDADMIRKSVDAARNAVLHGGDPLDGPEDFALALAQSLFELYETTDDTSALDESAAVSRAALAPLPALHPERYRHLLRLGRTLRAQARAATGDATALPEAVDLLKEAATATPPGHPGRANTLGNLVLALQELYDATGDQSVLDESIDIGRLAEEAAPSDSARRGIQGNLANSLLDRHRLAGSMTDLDEAVAIGRRTVVTVPPGDRDEANHLTSLADQLLILHQATGDESALTESIAVGRRAVAAASAGGPAAVAARSHLSLALATLFERTDSEEALDEAVALRRETVLATPDGSPALAGQLSQFTGVLRTLYERTDSRIALEEAAECARRLMPLLIPAQAQYPLRMVNVAATLHRWSELAHDEEAAEVAVTAAAFAVDALPRTHTARPALLSNHCGILLGRYRRTGDIARLTDAWNSAEEAVRTAHPADPDRPLYLLNFAMASRSRHERTGDPDVLREGVRACEAALCLAPPGDPLRPALLSQMSLGTQARYQRSGELRHLAESVEAAREAALACPSGHPDHAMYQSNLSAALQMLHRRQGPQDAARTIGQAVAAARAAVVATEPGDPELPALLSHLCGALMFQYASTGGRRELAAAVTAGRRAVALSPPGHPGQTHRLANLTAAWRLRYRHDALPRALREAVATARRAVESLASDHPDEASVLTGCAAALRTAHRAGSGGAELEEALRLLDRATHSTASPIGDRLRASRALGRAALEAGETRRALRGYEDAVDLLGQLAPWRLSRADREFGLGELEGLGSEAAGAALSCGDSGRAVELLEQTRGVMLHQTLDLRGDIDTLRAASSDLADAFEELRTRRDAADHIGLTEQFGDGWEAGYARGSGAGDPGDVNDPGEAARRIAAERSAMDAEWNTLLSRIRALPRLEGFLGRPDLESLRQQAGHGFVIMLAVSGHRADALVLTPDPKTPVTVVGLPGMTESRVIDRAERLLGGRVPGSPPVTDYAQAKRRMRELVDLLEWQWDHVAEPVLKRIGLTRSLRPDDDPAEWPRIWWCPAGATAFLPWHASGHHGKDGAEGGATRTVMDRAVSSWTPTVRALAHARRPSDAAPQAVRSALLVEMAQPAGANRSLRHVAAEVDQIAGLLPGATRLRPPHNTPRAVREALPAHPVAHFACHAVSEWGSPGRSGLLLGDPDDHGHDRDRASDGDDQGRDGDDQDRDNQNRDGDDRNDHDLDRADLDGDGSSGTARLTVDAISSRHIPGAELAYLSACSTSLGNQRLADESVHITAGFMLGGYRHVIGTLWPVDDTAAREIAVDFYTGLAGTDGAGPRTEDAAHALHLALHEGRAKRPWAPSLWAAHLHTGA